VTPNDGLQLAPRTDREKIMVPNRPVSDLKLITIGSKNNVPQPGHHYYMFHLASDQADKPFCFEESVGGGHTAGGGAICLALHELDAWPGEWRDHLTKAGCGWVADVIDSRRDDDTQSVVDEILKRHGSF